MGRRIAELYVNAGYEVSVWNITPGKANGLRNVQVMRSFEEAVHQGDLHIICVYDNLGTREILESLADKQILKEKTVLNFTTGSPKEVQVLENFLNKFGRHYLNGAVQVAPDQMGLKETTILNGWSAPYPFKIDCRLASAWWQPSTCRGGRSDFGSYGSGEFDVVVPIF